MAIALAVISLNALVVPVEGDVKMFRWRLKVVKRVNNLVT